MKIENHCYFADFEILGKKISEKILTKTGENGKNL